MKLFQFETGTGKMYLALLSRDNPTGTAEENSVKKVLVRIFQILFVILYSIVGYLKAERCSKLSQSVQTPNLTARVNKLGFVCKIVATRRISHPESSSR